MFTCLKSWDELPEFMRTDEVRPYYDSLNAKKGSLIFKRIIDIFLSLFLLVLLFPVFLILFILIKRDSQGPVFFRQERITQYGRSFRIHKFRTMVVNAEALGSQVTVDGDTRVTAIGHMLRKYRLDELPQLIDVLKGDMSFVGTRPEVKKYVDMYTPEMCATLLLPAGITSDASIHFKDEAEIIRGVSDVDQVYTSKILPKKMSYNLQSIHEFSLFSELKIMFDTVLAVLH